MTFVISQQCTGVADRHTDRKRDMPITSSNFAMTKGLYNHC